MKTCMLSLQKELYQILSKDQQLKSKIKGVFDYVDEDSKFPIITIGDCVSSDYSTSSFDGEEVVQDVHIWSKYKGNKEVKELLSIATEVIFRDLRTLEGGFEIDLIKRDGIEVFTDIDPTVKHGVLRLRITIREI